MKAIFSSKSFWITVFFSTILIFMASLDLGKTYHSEIEILIIPKNELAKSNISQILENAIRMPQMLSFYEKINDEFDNSIPTISQKSDYGTKKIWNTKLDSEIINTNGLIMLTAYDTNKASAENISRKSAFALAQELSKFYDIKNSIDVRIINGPKTEIIQNYGYPTKLVGSFAVSIIVIYFSFLFVQATVGASKIQKIRSKAIANKINKKLERRCLIYTPEQAKQRLSYLLKEIVF